MPSDANKMKVTINRDKNRLYCSWNGVVSKDDFERFFTEVRFAVSDLQPDFAVINDLTHCNCSALAGIPTFQQVMKYLVDQGMKDVVRIVVDKSLVFSQFSNLSLKTQGYVPVYVHSLEEADHFLDSQAQRHHIRLKMLDKEIKFEIGDNLYTGTLKDLSLGGCAICSGETTPAQQGQCLEVYFSLAGKKAQIHNLTFSAMVIRTFDDGFAAVFSNPDDLTLKKLTECLSQSVLSKTT